jgi:hypothetical protein
MYETAKDGAASIGRETSVCVVVRYILRVCCIRSLIESHIGDGIDMESRISKTKKLEKHGRRHKYGTMIQHDGVFEAQHNYNTATVYSGLGCIDSSQQKQISVSGLGSSSSGSSCVSRGSNTTNDGYCSCTARMLPAAATAGTATTSATSSTTTTTPNATTSSSNNSNSIINVQELIQECYHYHQQQEAIRQSGLVVAAGIPDTPDIYDSCSSNSDPVVAVVATDTIASSNSNRNRDVMTLTTAPPHGVVSTAGSSSSSLELLQQQQLQQQQQLIDDARKRALDVVTRFQPAPPLPTTSPVAPLIGTLNHNNTMTTTAMTVTNTNNNNNNIDYVQQRHIGFLREQQRKQLFVIKNLQYMIQRHQSQIQQSATTVAAIRQQHQPVTNVEHTTQLHNVQTQSHIRPNTKRRKRTTTSTREDQITQSHIDTDDTNHRHHHHHHHQYDSHSNSNNTIALYVSTHPPITSTTNEYWNETYLQGVFPKTSTAIATTDTTTATTNNTNNISLCLRNVYLYRQKTNGKYKGDGIIVYKISNTVTDHTSNDYNTHNVTRPNNNSSNSSIPNQQAILLDDAKTETMHSKEQQQLIIHDICHQVRTSC